MTLNSIHPVVLVYSTILYKRSKQAWYILCYYYYYYFACLNNIRVLLMPGQNTYPLHKMSLKSPYQTIITP